MAKKLDIKAITKSFERQDILSLSQFDRQRLMFVFSLASDMKKLLEKKKASDILKGTITTLLFYEPSSRTFSSFAAAVRRLGGTTIDIQNPKITSSVAKGETLEDTVKTFESYSDCIVIRHPDRGSAQQAADAAFFVPVINAGDGIGEHPTQALLDLFTIVEHHKTLDRLTGVIAGDLLNGRTVHSLLKGLSLFENNTVYLLSPKQLRLPRLELLAFQKQGLTIYEIEKETEIPKNAHFWYWTRVQKERFKDLTDYEKVKNRYIVTPKLMERAGKQTILMHPLPRVGEITEDVDQDTRAVYFRSQIRNGVCVRMALLALVLGRVNR